MALQNSINNTALQRIANFAGKRVRLFYGDPNTGVDRLEEFEILGTLSLEDDKPYITHCANAREGQAFNPNHVVRIMDVKTKRDLYRHPTYRLPHLAARGVNLFVDGSHFKECESETEAKMLIELYRGNRHRM